MEGGIGYGLGHVTVRRARARRRRAGAGATSTPIARLRINEMPEVEVDDRANRPRSRPASASRAFRRSDPRSRTPWRVSVSGGRGGCRSYGGRCDEQRCRNFAPQLCLTATLSIALHRRTCTAAGRRRRPAPHHRLCRHCRSQRARAIALFQEAGKVLQHPRCVNCHPAGDSPRQTDQRRPHQPLVVRGADGHGAPTLACNTCHGPANFDPARVPGHPEWHLAPLAMAWEGRSLGQICEQIKDRARNGDRDMAALLHHLGEDTLVGWAWTPGFGRRLHPAHKLVLARSCAPGRTPARPARRRKRKLRPC